MIAGDIIGERARIDPSRCALISVATGERLSYAELDRRTQQMAQIWTAQLGLQPGDRIGILALNSIEYIAAFLACGKSGIILVPLNSRQTAHELAFVVEDAGLAALLYETEFAAVAEELGRQRPQMKRLPLDGPEWHSAQAATADAPFQNHPCAPEDVFCLLYTSGTTGRPKGVMLPHRMIVWNAYNTAISWQLRDNDVIPIFTPLHHAGGLTVFLTAALLLGATLVLHRRFDASEVWQQIERERATVMMAVPTIFKMLMDAPEFPGCDCGSLRWCISGGAPLPLYLIEAYQRRGILLKQGYGLTEVGVNCFAMSDENARRHHGSIGRPMLFTQARCIREDGSPAPSGEIGELCLKGAHTCLGYWRNPEATAAVLDAEGWFHTGDKARVDEHGMFYIVGRAKDMFISGGVNVYPAEVEAALLLCEGVEDAAVIGVEHPKWGEVGAAFVVPRAGATLGSDQLNAALIQRLARYKLPRHYIFVDELPRTAFGKVVKGELQRRFASFSPPFIASKIEI